MIGYHEITQADLKEQNLATLNSLLRQVIEEINRQSGFTGPVVMAGDLDMAGHRILNVGSAQADGDAVSRAAGDSRFVGSKTLQKTLEATGKNLMQTTRRLNDTTQREQSSSFLNRTGVSLAQANNSTITVAAAGPNSTITLSAGTGKFGDDETYAYPQRVDTVANPGAGSDYYYYYYDVALQVVQMYGPYSADTSYNRLVGNRDGRSFLGFAKVDVGGGGSGGGGGDKPGCCEIGTQIVLPAGSTAEIDIEPCNKWVELRLENGRRVAVAPRTLISVFIPAEKLESGQLVEIEDGDFCKLIEANKTERASHKVVMRRVQPGRTYLGNGVRLHNLKP